jgi:hypothetical protein
VGPTASRSRDAISFAASFMNASADLLGPGATGADQPGDAADEDPGLARPGASDHQQRAAAVMGDGGPLVLVERVEERVGRRHRGASSGSWMKRRAGPGAEAPGPG